MVMLYLESLLMLLVLRLQHYHGAPQKQVIRKRLTKFAPVINRLETNFCDVPLSLLTDLVQESGEEEKVMETEKYYGNCLAHAR